MNRQKKKRGYDRKKRHVSRHIGAERLARGKIPFASSRKKGEKIKLYGKAAMPVPGSGKGMMTKIGGGLSRPSDRRVSKPVAKTI